MLHEEFKKSQHILKTCLFTIFITCATVLVFLNQSACAAGKNPVKIYVGVYPLRVHQLSLKEKDFQADFYIWFRWKGEKTLPGFEIINGDYSEVGETEKADLPGGYHYEAKRLKGTFYIDINLKDYPFDRHKLMIQVENQELERSDVIYVPDNKSMTDLKTQSAITGWETVEAKVYEAPHVYKTNFGKYGDEPRSEYSQLIYRITVARKILPYTMKFSIPLFVITFMAFSVLFIHPSDTGTRTGIGITAILSTVAFHISQADALPEVGYLVVADIFFILTYIACAVALIETIATHVYINKDNTPRALSIDRWAKILLPLFYFTSFFAVILLKIL